MFLGYAGGRNIDSSSAQHAKERFAPREHHRLIEGEMSDNRERPEDFVDICRLTIPMRFAVCVDSSYVALMSSNPLASQLH